ncbi:MAG: permease, partial [Candidatus Omnitrophica bacterium]|nr:permease [Candidatus Omnitrophota bacterium]
MKNRNKLLLLLFGFIFFYHLPIESLPFRGPFFESLALTKWYAREHVLLCLIPAFFIAGAISVFVSQGSVIKYFGAKAKKVLAYGVASVSGTILTVCSCTVLPLFAGIYKKGAGLGPAITFLYSGPAINVLAIIMTARILGWQIGLARAIGAVFFSVVIGLLMHFIFLKEERQRHAEGSFQLNERQESRPLWK